MKKLRHFIIENKESFDFSEPNEGHFERFMDRINIENPKELKLPIYGILKIAAIFILVIGISVVLINNIDKSKNGAEVNRICLSDISDDYEEVENFYNSRIEQKMKILNDIAPMGSDIEKDFLNEEFKEIDKSYSELQKELSLNVQDRRIIEAMIRNYQIKTNILDKIIYQLDSINPKI